MKLSLILIASLGCIAAHNIKSGVKTSDTYAGTYGDNYSDNYGYSYGNKYGKYGRFGGKQQEAVKNYDNYESNYDNYGHYGVKQQEGVKNFENFESNYGQDKNIGEKQKFIFDVLRHVNQPFYSQENKKYIYVEDKSAYTDYKFVLNFFRICDRGFLPQNHVFSTLNEKHMEEAIALFNLFFYSKDFTTFYQNVLWARQHVNGDMFVYALSLAVVHRPDMHGIVLPAIYEIHPYLFFASPVINQAINYKLQDLDKTGNKIYHINADYTSDYYNMNEDSKLAYLTEDIGWNSYYYYKHIDYPYWMQKDEFNLNKDRRGEYYFYTIQQILARYYWERLSNGMGTIPELSWITPIKIGYNSQLRHYNGLGYTYRNNYYQVYSSQDYHTLNLIEDCERRIRDAIETGNLLLPGGQIIDMRKPNSIDELGTYIQTNGKEQEQMENRSLNLLHNLARILLTGNHHYQENKDLVIPNVHQRYETLLRDPVTYQLFKRIVKYYFQFKNNLHHYKYEDLNYSGVKIQNVKVGKLLTYFDYFDADITNGVDVNDLYNVEHEYSNTEMDHYNKYSYYKFNNPGVQSQNDNMYTGRTEMMDKDYVKSRYTQDYKNTNSRKSRFFNDENIDNIRTNDDTMFKRSQPQTQNYNINSQTDYVIMAKQLRLNHKPFPVNVDVISDKAQQVVVRFYMAPKLDQYRNLYNLNENRDNFVEIDQFIYDLPAGQTTITRDSKDFYYTVKDRTTYNDLYKKIMMGVDNQFALDISEAHCGFPDRLLLPKGWVEGMPMHFFVMITPSNYGGNDKQYNAIKHNICGIGAGGRFNDNLPLGYPFDRQINDAEFYTPNMYFQDVFVYHRSMDVPSTTVQY